MKTWYHILESKNLIWQSYEGKTRNDTLISTHIKDYSFIVFYNPTKKEIKIQCDYEPIGNTLPKYIGIYMYETTDEKYKWKDIKDDIEKLIIDNINNPKKIFK